MNHKLRFTPNANEQLNSLENDHALEGVFSQVRKTLG
jgi:hypothetical protein